MNILLKNILEKKLLILLILIFFIFSLYYIPKTNPLKWQYMHQMEQAEAFLNLRLNLNNRYNLVELIEINNKYFTVLPPGPVLLILPLFAVFRYDLNFQIIMQVVALLCIILMYNLVYKLTNNRNSSLILTIAFSFGTVFLWVANHIGTWFTNQIFALFFILLLLNECFGKKRGALIGLCLGLAFLSRQLTIFYIIFALSIIFIKHYSLLGKHEKSHFFTSNIIKNRLLIKDIIAVIGISGIFIFLYMILNYLKFGGIFDTGYNNFFTTPTFQLKNIPANLYQYFFRPPNFAKTFPFISPPATGQAIIFTTPLFLLAFHRKLKKELLIPIWLTIFFIFTAHMLYSYGGGGQLGMRYSLDYMPLLFCLLAYRYKKKIDASLIFLTCLSFFFCLSGTFLLTVYWNH